MASIQTLLFILLVFDLGNVQKTSGSLDTSLFAPPPPDNYNPPENTDININENAQNQKVSTSSDPPVVQPNKDAKIVYYFPGPPPDESDSETKKSTNEGAESADTKKVQETQSRPVYTGQNNPLNGIRTDSGMDISLIYGAPPPEEEP